MLRKSKPSTPRKKKFYKSDETHVIRALLGLPEEGSCVPLGRSLMAQDTSWIRMDNPFALANKPR